MILAGDIGGTKTVLALYEPEAGIERPLAEELFVSDAHAAFEDVVSSFLSTTGAKPTRASFGVAGPVIGGRSQITNLPWVIDAEALAARFEIPRVHLLNDLEAIAYAVPGLGAAHLHTLNPGRPAPGGTIAVVAPGTGLGVSFLAWTGTNYRPHATEGGHASFAPATPEQIELLAFMQHRFGHVSNERVCSGSGIPNLMDYVRSTGRYHEPDWLRKALSEADDPTPVIVNTALERSADACVAALDMFVRILGGIVGNTALKLLTTGGIYLGGGIPPRILSRLQQADFLAAVRNKGRFADLVSNVPIHVILDPMAALHGAARHALDQRDE
ncbi:MAG: glucokinase [Rhodospirillales bacterium]|nr:glucokinase [Rhodospirillales bacterium]